MDQLRLFAPPPGIHCSGCRLREDCGAQFTEEACKPELDLDGPAGSYVLHPARSDFDEHFNAVGGSTFEDLVGSSIELPPLPLYLPQVRPRAKARTENQGLTVGVVGVRLEEVLRNSGVRDAESVRRAAGLESGTAVVLLLHGRDSDLERIDRQALDEIAYGGFTLVTPRSFSLWEPRRRPDTLLSLRRSALDHAALRALDAPACLRVGWTVARDVERLADFANRWGINVASLDLMTYGPRSFARAVVGMARFDELTDRRIHYLVDGVMAVERIAALYFAASPTRVSVSSATMAPPDFRLDGAGTLADRTAAMTRRCRVASNLAIGADANSVESFLDAIAESTPLSIGL